MVDVINLRQARKQRDRAAKARTAEANRAVHGESKAAKAARKADAERAARLLDGSRVERD